MPDAPGHGPYLIDLEQGWTLDHEGLAPFRPRLLHGTIVDASRAHGTRVLGVIAARCPGLDRLDVVSHSGDYDAIPAAISCAVSHLEPGQVLLLEVMDAHHLPIERRPAVWHAVRAAVDAGIVVIAPAGNAGADLDLGECDTLAPQRPGFRDSGAVLVSACEYGYPGRLPGSNYGCRVDCHEVGEHVATLDSDPAGDCDAETDDFGQTSAAAAQIAATVVLLQAAAAQRLGRWLTPAEVRQRLRDPAGGIATANPARDRIGPRPVLDELLRRLPPPG